MTVTIELSADTKAELEARAEAAGVPLDHYLKALIEQLAGTAPGTLVEDRVAAFDEWADNLEVPSGTREGTFHRENWY